MCGICCICNLTCPASDQQCPWLDLDHIRSNSLISRRGPDLHGSVTCTLWSDIPAIFAGFVLHLRGSQTPQPMKNESGDILLWNGEIFGGIEVGASENDTQVLFNRLENANDCQDILATIQSIQGPWAFIFWQAEAERLWFGRDVLGRRSLLWHLPEEDGVFSLSSLPVGLLDHEEVPALGVFCLESSRKKVSCKNSQYQSFNQSKNRHASVHMNLHLYPWQRATWPGTDNEIISTSTKDMAQQLGLEHSTYMAVVVHSDKALHSWIPVFNSEVPASDHFMDIADSVAKSSDLVEVLQEVEKRSLSVLVTQFKAVLEKAVMKRVRNLPRLYHSGTCACCSVKLDFTCHSNHLCNNECGVSSFVSSNSYLKGTSSNSVTDNLLCESHSSLDISNASEQINHLNCVLSEVISSMVPEEQRRPDSSFDPHKIKQLSGVSCEANCSSHCDQPARVAILFSGGLDSTVLAALADRCLPIEESIDLINVAFEQKLTSWVSKKEKVSGPTATMISSSSSFSVPDRLTGYAALSELNHHRKWNFIEVNVTQEVLKEQRSQRVRHLVYPLKTVLDDSIGCAVWFAAMGKGILGNGPRKGAQYNSSARVVLCGMGADEQLAGYSRHRIRFQQESWPGLVNEINIEIHRISARNLGRDDRIIADHGKESRFPFLDEDVVAFLASLPVHLKADLHLPRGVGEKLLLRLLALHLGLPTAAVLPKRAIQFGSRIAKLEERKEKGSQICQRLLQD